MLEGEDVSRLLDILGNRNRRRIIQLLKLKPCFVTEISERLMLSPKAVIEHLQLMEREQVLQSHCDDRRRKYYYLSQDIEININLHRQPHSAFQQIINKESRFFNSLSMLRRMIGARENLIANLEDVERDIDLKIKEMIRFGDGFISEQGVQLLVILSTYELTLEELDEISWLSPAQVREQLRDLMARGIVERTGDYYRVRDENGT